MNNCSIEMKMDKAAQTTIENAISKSLLQTADYIVGDVVQNQYIPFNTGTLQTNRHFYQEGNDVIIGHNVPYDIYVYYGDKMNFQKTNNHNAKSRWYKDYENGNKDYKKIEEFYSDRIKRNSGGYVK